MGISIFCAIFPSGTDIHTANSGKLPGPVIHIFQFSARKEKLIPGFISFAEVQIFRIIPVIGNPFSSEIQTETGPSVQLHRNFEGYACIYPLNLSPGSGLINFPTEYVSACDAYGGTARFKSRDGWGKYHPCQNENQAGDFSCKQRMFHVCVS